jgi:hypothetical protein
MNSYREQLERLLRAAIEFRLGVISAEELTFYENRAEIQLKNPPRHAALAERLRELAHAVTQGPDAVRRAFYMSVPARPEHDADLVLSTAAGIALDADAREAADEVRTAIPVSERLPAPKDCLGRPTEASDGGWCWVYFSSAELWRFTCVITHELYEVTHVHMPPGATHWLPHYVKHLPAMRPE